MFTQKDPNYEEAMRRENENISLDLRFPKHIEEKVKALKFIHFLGPPSVGKGTLGNLLHSEKKGIIHISIGELLRNETKQETHISKLISFYVNHGLIINPKISLFLFFEWMKKLCSSDLKVRIIIVDGFPRNIENYREMENSGFFIDSAFFVLQAEKETLFERMKKRKTSCNRTDDNLLVLERRLEIYMNDTKKMLELASNKLEIFYINTEKPLAEIVKEISQKIELD